MTPEQISALVDKLGFPVAMCVVMVPFIYFLFRQMTKAMNGQSEAMKAQIIALRVQAEMSESHAKDVKIMSATNTAALNANTASNKDVTIALGKVSTICKMDEITRLAIKGV